MKKNTIQHVLPLALLVVSTALITACDKGGARTPEGAVEKARCQRGFNTDVENQKLVAAVSQNVGADDTLAIRTYITTFKADTTKPSFLNPNSINIVSTKAADESFLKSADAIVVTKNCEDRTNLTASVKGPGFFVENMTIKKTDVLSIELEKVDLEKNEVISIKVEKAARLQAQDDALDAQIKDPSTKNKHKLKAALKTSKDQQIARGNLITKVTIDIKGASEQSYVIEQRSGEFFNEEKIKFDDSVKAMIKDRTSTTGALETLATTPASVEKLTEPTTEKELTDYEVATELKARLDSAAGLSQLPVEEETAQATDEKANETQEPVKESSEEVIKAETVEPSQTKVEPVQAAPAKVEPPKVEAAKTTTSAATTKATTPAATKSSAPAATKAAAPATKAAAPAATTKATTTAAAAKTATASKAATTTTANKASTVSSAKAAAPAATTTSKATASAAKSSTAANATKATTTTATQTSTATATKAVAPAAPATKATTTTAAATKAPATKAPVATKAAATTTTAAATKKTSVPVVGN